jgi:hypothetical protein
MAKKKPDTSFNFGANLAKRSGSKPKRRGGAAGVRRRGGKKGGGS